MSGDKELIPHGKMLHGPYGRRNLRIRRGVFYFISPSPNKVARVLDDLFRWGYRGLSLIFTIVRKDVLAALLLASVPNFWCLHTDPWHDKRH